MCVLLLLVLFLIRMVLCISKHAGMLQQRSQKPKPLLGIARKCCTNTCWPLWFETTTTKPAGIHKGQQKKPILSCQVFRPSVRPVCFSKARFNLYAPVRGFSFPACPIDHRWWWWWVPLLATFWRIFTIISCDALSSVLFLRSSSLSLSLVRSLSTLQELMVCVCWWF